MRPIIIQGTVLEAVMVRKLHEIRPTIERNEMRGIDYFVQATLPGGERVPFYYNNEEDRNIAFEDIVEALWG